MIHSTITMLPSHARVFLRVDANIPLANGIIQSDFRLQALKPTLDLLVQKNAIVIFATHIGRPTKHDYKLSTQLLASWLNAHGYTAQFAPTISDAYSLSEQKKPLFIVLENLRFFAEEQNGSLDFAQELARLADFYINDAFATLHRKDTSIYVLPTLFSPEKRMIGPLIEKEMRYLTALLHRPRTGFTLVLGGGKISTKIPLIQALLSKVDTIILCPAIVFTFLKAYGHNVGNSLVDTDALKTCKQITENARIQNCSLIFPLDYQIAEGTFNGPLSYIEDTILPDNAVGISIGPKSTAMISAILNKSSTIFYNGLMGTNDRPETMINAGIIFNSIAASQSYSVIAGGDSIALVEKENLVHKINYLSTGGGATLAFLTAEPLSGLMVFNV